MKNLFLVVSLALVFNACKKEENEPATPDPTPGQIIPKPKSIEYKDFEEGQIDYKGKRAFVYNSLDQIISINCSDSFYEFQKWLVHSYLQTIRYTDFDKIDEKTTSGSLNSSELYLYNSSRQLIKIEYSASRTAFFNYTGNQVISELKIDDLMKKSYYSENLDSILYFTIPSDTLVAKMVYRRNTNIDLDNSYWNKYLGIVSDKHELQKIIYTNYSSLTPYGYSLDVSYVYNEKGWPIEKNVHENGILQSITYYTYH